jgi:hypothetical protein
MYVFAPLLLLCNIVILASSQRKVRRVPRIGLETDTRTTSFLKMAINIKTNLFHISSGEFFSQKNRFALFDSSGILS